MKNLLLTKPFGTHMCARGTWTLSMAVRVAAGHKGVGTWKNERERKCISCWDPGSAGPVALSVKASLVAREGFPSPSSIDTRAYECIFTHADCIPQTGADT